MRTIFEKSAFEIYVEFEHGKIMQISSVIDSKNVQLVPSGTYDELSTGCPKKKYSGLIRSNF